MFKRSGVWWTCIRHNGRKIQKSLGTANKKSAQKIENRIKDQINDGKYFEKLIGRNKTFKDMMDKFMEEYAPKMSRNMQVSYSTSLKHLNPFFVKFNLLSITPKRISRYKVIRNGEGAAAGSLNLELAMLSKAFSLAVKEWEWLRENPVFRVPSEKNNNARDRWLSRDEELRLLDASPEWIRELITVALNTGVRQQELLSLEWSRVNLFRKTILIQDTKNGKPKTLPLNKFALGVLKKRFKFKSIRNDLVFFSRKGNRINPATLRGSFYRVLAKAGITNFRWHDTRHTFATRLAQAGVDLYKISKLLGHKDIKMTQRYAHHCPESLREGVEALEADYNLTTIEEKHENLSL